MFHYIFEKKTLKELAGIMLLLNSVIIILSLSIFFVNSMAIKAVHQEIADLKAKVDTEIKMREELFTTLRKSASLLRKYNPRLDEGTAFRYALKIYECSEHPVTPELLTALIVAESGANHVAVSNRGAIGLTQILPSLWHYPEEELFNPYRNIEIGSNILKYYVDKHGIRGGLSSYNGGSRHKSLDYAKYVLTIAEDSLNTIHPPFLCIE